MMILKQPELGARQQHHMTDTSLVAKEGMQCLETGEQHTSNHRQRCRRKNEADYTVQLEHPQRR